MTEVIDFRFGSLIRTGPTLVNGGKWHADLVEWNRNQTTNADLTIYIRVFFDKIDPAGGARTGTHMDYDTNRRIQRWAPGEFERFVRNLTTGASRFWNGVFWLQTPPHYHGLDYPDTNPTHRCNLYCRFELEAAPSAADAHYTIAVCRVRDGEVFRSHSTLFSQRDIQSDHRIPRSTTRFWTHYHEVGHLIGLQHVGTGGTRADPSDGAETAYGVTRAEMEDVMGRGHTRHNWHAGPWQQAAEAFTSIRAADWTVAQHRLYPARL